VNKKKNKLVEEIELDFNGVTVDRTIKFNFKNNISKSQLYISKKTGTLFHSPSNNSIESLDIWSKKIYSKKIDTKKIKYTSNNPIMRSRHYYSALFLNKYLKNKSIEFCDYGTGEGNLALEFKRINKKINFNFTEHSPHLFRKTKKKILDINKKKFLSFNGSIEDSKKNHKFKNFDACSLLWTLCNCVKPIDVLNTIHASLKKNGLLLISESSRIMVPYKKPIYNFFVSGHHAKNTHPWFFSYNSLSNLLEICGFSIIATNRYYDENDLVVIAQKKNKKKYVPKIKIDKVENIKKFLTDWEKNSFFLKRFI
tara:strand:- start:38693 stop:39625 length:933 start_codon:yes stop_codon:yes gene_type:complete